MQKLSDTKCNVHMQIGISEVNPTNTSYGIFSYDTLLSLLGLTNLTFNVHQTQFIPLNRTLNHPADVRAGYQIGMENRQIIIGRYYYYNDASQGWGGYKCDSLYNLDILRVGIYEVNIYGATYS